MTFVRGIEGWESGAPVAETPAGFAACAAGDFPTVRYDLDRVRHTIDRDRLGHGPATLWRYAPLLPVENGSAAVTFGEGWTPLLPAPRLAAELGCRRLAIKDEGRNPSGTFKDRGAAVAVSRLRELGHAAVVHNSSGNAAAAWALYCARAGLSLTNVVPADVLPASLAQSLMAGARTFRFTGPWWQAGAVVADLVRREGLLNVGTLKEPYRLEGKKTMGLELAEQLGWTLPDAIVYPTGGGLGAIAIYKAMQELRELGWVKAERLPKLIVSQYEGCAPIVKAFEDGADATETWTALDVPPGGLKSASPPGGRAVLRLLRDTGGTAIAVSAAEAMHATAAVTRLEGLFPCPEAATVVVALRKALAAGVVGAGDNVVLMITGTGLKSVPLLDAGVPLEIAAGDPPVKRAAVPVDR